MDLLESPPVNLQDQRPQCKACVELHSAIITSLILFLLGFDLPL